MGSGKQARHLHWWCRRTFWAESARATLIWTHMVPEVPQWSRIYDELINHRSERVAVPPATTWALRQPKSPRSQRNRTKALPLATPNLALALQPRGATHAFRKLGCLRALASGMENAWGRPVVFAC